MSKFNAKRTETDGITFHSADEAHRYQDLKLLELAGEISDLKLQVSYSFDLNGVHIGHYVADFVYRTRDGQSVVEDFKGMITPVYRLKKRLMLAFYNIPILETTRSDLS